MSLVLDATPGGASANSYLTRAEADSYFEGRLHAELWAATSDANQDAALVWATRLLDSMVEFAGPYKLDTVGDFTSVIYSFNQGFGRRTTTAQALEWPRSGLLSRNRLELLSSSIVPVEIKNATAELSLQLISGDRSADSDIETQGLTSLSVGSISMDFKETVKSKVIPDAVWNMIPTWWIVGRRDSGRAFARIARY